MDAVQSVKLLQRGTCDHERLQPQSAENLNDYLGMFHAMTAGFACSSVVLFEPRNADVFRLVLQVPSPAILLLLKRGCMRREIPL